MMTTWVILIFLAIGIVWLINKKPREEVQQQQEPLPSIQHNVELQTMSSNIEEEEELIAVITAAIAEFTGASSDEIKVLKIGL